MHTSLMQGDEYIRYFFGFRFFLRNRTNTNILRSVDFVVVIQITLTDFQSNRTFGIQQISHTFRIYSNIKLKKINDIH